MKSFLSPSRVLPFASLLVLLAAACGSSSSGSTGTGGSTSTTSTTAGTGGSTTTSGTGGSGTGGLGPGQCHTQMDCQNGDFCSVDILPAFCGGVCDTTFSDDCQADGDCADAGTGLICDKPCACFHGGAVPGNRCTAGCATNADCGPSLACNATHRCEPAPCAAPADDCTPNYMCTAGACAPRTCAADADCGGRCVNGYCAPTLGTCRPAVP